MTSETNEKIALLLDMTGKECFQIRLELRVQINKIAIDEIIKVITDNPQSLKSMPKWCKINNQELFLSDIQNGKYLFYIKRIS